MHIPPTFFCLLRDLFPHKLTVTRKPLGSSCSRLVGPPQFRFRLRRLPNEFYFWAPSYLRDKFLFTWCSTLKVRFVPCSGSAWPVHGNSVTTSLADKKKNQVFTGKSWCNLFHLCFLKATFVIWTVNPWRLFSKFNSTLSPIAFLESHFLWREVFLFPRLLLCLLISKCVAELITTRYTRFSFVAFIFTSAKYLPILNWMDNNIWGKRQCNVTPSSLLSLHI